MKFLISDYDGTIKTYDKSPNIFESYTFIKNIESINAFYKENKFAIATGRNTSSIQNEASKYKILYNYLISYNGRVIVDKNNNLLNAQYINKKFIDELNYINIKNITLYDEYEKIKSKNNLIYIYLTLNNRKDANKYLLEWRELYPDLQIDYNQIFNYIIIRKKYNKVLGIKKLLDIENINIPKKNIITIGDETNDLEMIKEYDGYRMLISNPKLLFTTKNVATSVHKLIKKIK